LLLQDTSLAPEDIASACDALVAMAFERNSQDNMTAMVVLLAPPPSAQKRIEFD